MAVINLRKEGKHIIIDDGDYELVSKYSWYWRKCGKCEYAISYKWLQNNKQRWFYVHQLIMGTIETKQEVDHINHNGLDNQRHNLRIVSHSDSIKNRRKHRGTSKYWGVSRHLGYTWIAHININGKQHHLGCFKEEIEAARAYNEAAIKTGNPCYNLNNL